jgi:hypothetical protein
MMHVTFDNILPEMAVSTVSNDDKENIPTNSVKNIDYRGNYTASQRPQMPFKTIKLIKKKRIQFQNFNK